MTVHQSATAPSAAGTEGLTHRDQGGGSVFTLTPEADGVLVDCHWLLDGASSEWFDFTHLVSQDDLSAVRGQYQAHGAATLDASAHQLKVHHHPARTDGSDGAGSQVGRTSVELVIGGALPRSLYLRDVPGLHACLSA